MSSDDLVTEFSMSSVAAGLGNDIGDDALNHDVSGKETDDPSSGLPGEGIDDGSGNDEEEAPGNPTPEPPVSEPPVSEPPVEFLPIQPSPLPFPVEEPPFEVMPEVGPAASNNQASGDTLMVQSRATNVGRDDVASVGTLEDLGDGTGEDPSPTPFAGGEPSLIPPMLWPFPFEELPFAVQPEDPLIGSEPIGPNGAGDLGVDLVLVSSAATGLGDAPLLSSADGAVGL